MNKVVNNLLETIHQARDDWESESARAQLGQTSSVADTQLLIAAIGTGQSHRGLADSAARLVVLFAGCLLPIGSRAGCMCQLIAAM